MSEEDEYIDGSPIWDSLDIDLFVKVFSHTAFSPFFVALIPTFYVFQGAKITDNIVLFSAAYYVFVASFWAIKWISRLYSNQGSLFYAPRPFEWSDQIVVITGGASGVGELLANTLAVKSVSVVVLDLNPIQTQNYNIAYYKCDVSKWEEVEAVSKKVIEEIGQPTVIVNNAGVVQGKLILDLSPEDVQQTFGVTMSSAIGIHGVAQMTDYGASKAALINLDRSLRSELDKRYNCPAIRTTLVCPAHIHTPLFATVIPAPQFFFPTQHPIDVVKRVIQALDDTHSQIIYLPFFVHFMPYLQVLPDWFADFASWISNADFAMKDFVKMSGRRPEEGPAPPLVDNKEGFKMS
ncbi:retinal short-chain dehydrogenase/reductase [Mycena haematopus]|nr:retinal short-chain dehydrogenase/reductase [Mycena haematopus]